MDQLPLGRTIKHLLIEMLKIIIQERIIQERIIQASSTATMQLKVNIYKEAQLQLRGRLLMMLDDKIQLVNLWLTQVLLLRLLNINKLSVRQLNSVAG